jgi:hypothetical protein
MIELSDVELLVRGWKESGRRLRVKLESDEFVILATCTSYDVNAGHVTLQAGKHNSLELNLENFAFDFLDADPADNTLSTGETIESAIVGASSWGRLFLVLLKY